MITHYIKVAFRNLLKYKAQTIISVLGLAVGFTCFALSTLWIRYEMTYDSFHEGAERIYFVRYESNKQSGNEMMSITPYPLAGYLKNTFPEIESATNTIISKPNFTYNGNEYSSFQMMVDSSFFDILPIKILSGNTNFLINGGNEIAITEKLAGKVFGKEDPIGKHITIAGKETPVCAIVKDWPTHSNLSFDILSPNISFPRWSVGMWYTFIKTHENINPESFRQKLYQHEILEENNYIFNLTLTPITSVRYECPLFDTLVKFNHLLLFALTGGLVILCSQLNYLTLFIIHIRMRSKEIGLRVVCGSSNRGVILLFIAEFLATLLFAVFLGMILFELILPTFKELAEINSNNSFLLWETLLYFFGIGLIILFISSLLIYYYQKKTLANTIKGSENGKGKNLFQESSITFQLLISIGIIFCTLVMIKQIHFLTHTDRIPAREKRGNITNIAPYADVIKDELKKNPYITEVVEKSWIPLIPITILSYWETERWDDKPVSTNKIELEIIKGEQTFCDYYNCTLLQGEMLTSDSPKDKVMINETAVHSFGWDNPIGKTFLTTDSIKLQVIGVIQDFVRKKPTEAIKPIVFTTREVRNFTDNNNILFKFKEGYWKECRRQIESHIKEKYPELVHFNVNNAEEEFNSYLTSENALLKMLDFVSIVCIIISIFGIYSLVVLNCESRQKEIAVRKVNGAGTGTIVKMFLSRYLLLLSIASIITFPIGYLIMKSWLSNYIAQTPISWWIYISIWIVLALIIIVVTGWHIFKAASQNPAEIIKTE